MSDSLKNFIQKHRHEMDVHSPSANVWNALNKQLPAHNPSFIKSIMQKAGWKIATGVIASAATVAVVVYLVTTNNSVNNKTYTINNNNNSSITINQPETQQIQTVDKLAKPTENNTFNSTENNSRSAEQISDTKSNTKTQVQNFTSYNPDRLSAGNGMIGMYISPSFRSSNQGPTENQTEQPTFNVSPAITHVKCKGNHTGKIEIETSGVYTFNWSYGNKTTPDLNGLAAGTYTLTVSDAQGRSGIFAYTITEPAGIALSASSTPAHCSAGDGSISVNTSGTGLYSYLWSNGKTESVINKLTAGTYVVTVTDNKGCTAKTAVTVENASALSVNFTNSPSGPLKIDFTNNSVNRSASGAGETMWVWKFGDGQTEFNTNPSHTYAQPGSYKVCLIAKTLSGCIDSLCYEVDVTGDLYVSVPNIFTPNGDNKNDEFILTTKGIQKIELVILDFNFKKIFESSGTLPAWDGYTMTSTPAAEGNYYYSIKAYGNDNKIHEYKGFLRLNR